jgi:hypothetical protein
MAETMNWTVSLQIPAGPKLSRSGAMQVDAYDKVDVDVADGDSDVEVQIQPGGSGQVLVLMIATDQPSEDLTYKVNDSGADPIPLDQPVHAYFGAGPLALLDAAAGPNTLFLSNSTGDTAHVQVLVGRRATT